MIPDTAPLAVVEIFSLTWAGGFEQQHWFVAEFPKMEYASIVIRIDNKVFGAFIVERCGCFWREILFILGGIDTDTHFSLFPPTAWQKMPNTDKY